MKEQQTEKREENSASSIRLQHIQRWRKKRREMLSKRENAIYFLLGYFFGIAIAAFAVQMINI